MTSQAIATNDEHVALLIPALDEEQGIARVLSRVPSELVDTIIVCDNGSRDHTAEVAREHGADVVFEPKRGYGAACWRAIQALPPETTIVAFVDADDSDDPRELDDLLRPILSSEADFVIGSRIRRAVPGSLTIQQRFGNALACRLMRLFFGRSWTDLGPFRAIRRSALDELDMQDRGMGWTVEMQIKAARRKLASSEVDVSYGRRVGRSKISGTLSGAIRAGTKILWLIFRYGLLPGGGSKAH